MCPLTPPPPTRGRLYATLASGSLTLAFALAPSPAAGRSLSVRELVTHARQHAPQVAEARARLAAGEARARATGALPDPELDARLLRGGDGGISGEGALTIAVPLSRSRSAARDVAVAEVRASRLRLDVAIHQAGLAARRALLRLEHARASAALLTGRAERAEQHAELARAQRSAGLGDALDVPLAVAEALDARRAALRAAARVTVLQKELRLVAALAEGDAVAPATDTLGAAATAGAGTPIATGGAHTIEPAPVRAARLAAQRARLEAQLARAERAPALRFGPALVAGGGETALGVQLGIDLPVLGSGGRRPAAALAEPAATGATVGVAAQHTRALLSMAQGRLQQARRSLELLDEGEATKLREARTLAEQRFAAGKLDLTRLLALQHALTRQQQERLALRLEIAEARLDVEALIGPAPTAQRGEQ